MSFGRSTVAAGPASALVILGGLAVACGGSAVPEATVGDLMAVYGDRDYFELADRLEGLEETRDPRIVFLRAATAHAFNDPAASNRHLEAIETQGAALPDSLRVVAQRLRFRNHVRLHHYGGALDAARRLSSLPAADSAVRADVENEARAMRALAGAPAQRVVGRAPTEIRRRPDGRVPVTMGDSVRAYIFDTGANLSVLMRSEADALGLEVRPAGMQVGTSTGSEVTADVTVAPSVRVGNVEISDVAFLVLPDSVLTFGPTFRIPGIIGFPVLDALGEVAFHRGGVLRIPGTVPERPGGNLALDYLTPLVRVRVLDDAAVCDFDTGANRTSLHLPFYRRHRARIEGDGRADTIRTAGAGGERRIPAFVLDSVRIAFGDTAAVLDDVSVYTESVASPGSTESDCRLGLDALAGFDGYRINLRTMAFQPL